MKKYTLLFFAVCLIISFAAINIGVSLFGIPYSFDLTPDKRYTLSPETLDWLRHNRKGLFARLYVSPELQNDSLVRIMQVLEEYKANAHNQLSISLVETKAFTPAAAEAEKFGIRPLGSRENPLYFGLVLADDSGRSRSIPYLESRRLAYLEHDLSRNLSALGEYEKPVIGVLSPALELQKGDSRLDYSQDWPFISLLRPYYEIRKLSNGVAQIPPETKAVVIVNPRRVENNTVYALEQYLLRGGNLVIFYDAFSEAGLAVNGQPDMRPSGLENFLQNLGISYNARPQISDVGINPHFLTRNMNRINLSSSGSFTVNGDEVRFTELLSSAEGSLGGILEGTFHASFPEPPFDGELLSKLPFVSISVAPGKIFFFADSDMLHEALWLQPEASDNAMVYHSNNMDLIEKIIDYAAANRNLLSVVPRHAFKTCPDILSRFEEISKERYAAEYEETAKQKREKEEMLQQLRQNVVSGKIVASLKISGHGEALQKEIADADKALRRINAEIRQYRKKLEMLFMAANIVIFPGILIAVLYLAVSLSRRRGRNNAREYAHE